MYADRLTPLPARFAQLVEKVMQIATTPVVTATYMLLAAMLLVATAACGGTDAARTEVTTDTERSNSLLSLGDSETVEYDSSSITEPRGFFGPRVVPTADPDPNSEEARVLDAFERWVHALAAENWSGYLDVCNPTRDNFTPDQMEFVADTFFSPFGDLAGTNYRNVEVKLFGEETATVSSSLYSFENLLFDGFTYSWSKVDGRWYSDSSCDF